MRLLAALALLGGVAVAAEGCHGDNLLRAMERHGAEEYCSSVLGVAEATSTISIPEGVPTGYEEAKVSSACWCLLGISSATAAPPCHSKTVEGPMYSTVDGDISATATETSTEASGVVGRPAPTDTDIPGGYSFSVPGDGLTATTATTAWTCGLAEATTTVQVTETSVETVYVTALSSEGNAGRPPPPWTSASSGEVSPTSGVEFTVITLSGEPSGTSSGWASTITVPASEVDGVPVVTTIVSDGSEVVSTLTRTSLKPPQGRIGTTITMVINGTVTTITGEVHDVPPPTPTETTASSSSSGASQWTLPWISESTQISPTMTPISRISTVTSDVGGGVISTWAVTLPTGIPFPNTTSASPASTTSSSQLSIITSVISGGLTVITIRGPTSTASLNGTASVTTSTPSETRSGGISIVTSIIGGEATTITLIGGSTIRPANGTSMASLIPSETTSAGISLITSFIGGEATIITLIGGSTLSVPLNQTTSTTSTPSETSSAEVSVITSVIGGAVTTITVVGGSTLIPANGTSSSTASETQSGGFSVVTTVIGGSATTLTLIGGSTLTPSSALTTATATSSPSQTLSAGVSVITSFVDGVATTITVSDGSTLTSSTNSSVTPSPAATGGIIVITSIIDGSATTVTISDGSTIVASTTSSSAPVSSPTGEVIVVTSTINGDPTTFTVSDGLTLGTLLSSSAATATPSPTGGIIVITSIIEGQPTTFTVSEGTTLGTEPSSAPVSPPATANGGVIVITSTINGAVSTITVSNGSTVETPASSTATPTPTPSIGGIVVTTLINGEATTITVSDGVTLGEPSPTTSSTPTPTGEVIVITTIINGEPTTVTVSDGSTLSAPTSTTTTSTQSPTPTVGVIVITTIISGTATTLTVSDGSTLSGPVNTTSTLTQTPTFTGEIITITSTVNGEPVTLTISDGSTLLPTPFSSNGPGVFTVISSVIGGGASTWIISDGVTLPPPSNTTSATPTPTGQVIVITSIINGAASTWTVSDGSTLSPSTTTKTSSAPTGDAVALTSTLPDGRVSIWTLIGTATITGSQNATATSPSSSSSATASSTSGAFDSAFTGISIVASQNASTCYTLPSPTESLHESKLDTQGKTAPYIDAFYLDNTTNSVKYIRLMNESISDPVLIDVSDPAKLAIIDKDGDTLSVDSQGLHFASADCSPKIDVFISGFFSQINSLTNSTCTSAAALFDTPSGRPLQKRQTSAFDVLLRLKDQCGNAARDELPVAVSLGDNPCAVVPKEGDFVATCSWPGGSGPAGDCETSVEQTLDHLTKGSLDGTCPSMMSMWSLLSQELGNVINLRELLKPFVDAGLNVDTDRGQSLLDVIGSFLGIYDYSASTFGNSTSQAGSGMGDLIEGYGLTTIQTQVCRYLQTSSQPLNLAFTAGTTTTPSRLAEITTIPSPTPEYDRNITDPTVMACCPNPGNCIFSEGSKFYPPESSIAGSNCFCGSMLGGGGIAFRTGSCLEENQCSQEKPCGEGKVCLTGNCCGDGTNPVNVCVDATECNAPRTGKRWADLYEGTAMGMV